MARTGFNKHDIARDACQLFGPQAHQGYDWWWHGGNGVGTIQLFDRHDKLVDRVHAENIGCEYGEYEKLT